MASSLPISMLVIIASIFTTAFVFNLDDKPFKAERKAETAVCREMASQVLSGEASRFDYMATRCSAQFLVPEEEG